jgi:hypothetical protein
VDLRRRYDPVEILNTTVWARLAPSVVHGLGVFAIRAIPLDTTITDQRLCVGDWSELFRLSEEEFERLVPEVRDLILDQVLFTDEIAFFSPNGCQRFEVFLNHSDDPNVSEDLVTLRPIARGEELLIDYRRVPRGAPLHQVHGKFQRGVPVGRL